MFFPLLISRPSFTKQASNLWHAKKLLQNELNEKSSVNAHVLLLIAFQLPLLILNVQIKVNTLKGMLDMVLVRVNPKLITVSKDID